MARHGVPVRVSEPAREPAQVSGAGAGAVCWMRVPAPPPMLPEVAGVSLLELLLDPQPLIADTKKNASGANAVNALDR